VQWLLRVNAPLKQLAAQCEYWRVCLNAQVAALGFVISNKAGNQWFGNLYCRHSFSCSALGQAVSNLIFGSGRLAN
jgi:hypothetical protein